MAHSAAVTTFLWDPTTDAPENPSKDRACVVDSKLEHLVACRGDFGANGVHLHAAIPHVMAWAARAACTIRPRALRLFVPSCWLAGGRSWRSWAAHTSQVQQRGGEAQLCRTTFAPSARPLARSTSTGMAAAADVPAGALGPRDFDGWFTEVEAMWKGESTCMPRLALAKRHAS